MYLPLCVSTNLGTYQNMYLYTYLPMYLRNYVLTYQCTNLTMYILVEPTYLPSSVPSALFLILRIHSACNHLYSVFRLHPDILIYTNTQAYIYTQTQTH